MARGRKKAAKVAARKAGRKAVRGGRGGRGVGRGRGLKRGRPIQIADREVIAVSLSGPIKDAIRSVAEKESVSISAWIRTAVNERIARVPELTSVLEAELAREKERAAQEAQKEAQEAQSEQEKAAKAENVKAARVARLAAAREVKKARKAAAAAAATASSVSTITEPTPLRAVQPVAQPAALESFAVDGPVLLGTASLDLFRYPSIIDVMLEGRLIAKASLDRIEVAAQDGSPASVLMARFTSDFAGARPIKGLWLVPDVVGQTFDVPTAQLVTVLKSIQIVSGPSYEPYQALRAHVRSLAPASTAPSGGSAGGQEVTAPGASGAGPNGELRPESAA